MISASVKSMDIKRSATIRLCKRETVELVLWATCMKISRARANFYWIKEMIPVLFQGLEPRQILLHFHPTISTLDLRTFGRCHWQQSRARCRSSTTWTWITRSNLSHLLVNKSICQIKTTTTCLQPKNKEVYLRHTPKILCQSLKYPCLMLTLML